MQPELASDTPSKMLVQMDAYDTRARLIRLQTQRSRAIELGIERPSEYLALLDEAIEDVRVEYTISAVREIAEMRRDLARAAQG
jgi:hypothetical protein